MPTKAEEIVTCFHVLAELLVSDGEVSPAEQAIFRDAMRSVGITDEERDAARRPIARGVMEARMAELSPAVKLSLLDALVRCAVVDRELHENERAFIHRATQVMGLEKSDIAEAFERLRTRGGA